MGFSTRNVRHSVYHKSNSYHTASSRNSNSDGQAQDRGVYRRKIKNNLGEIIHEKYEPRLKRNKQSLSLGQYDTSAEAKTVHEIATFLYRNDQFGWLDFENGRFSGVDVGPNEDGNSRYFRISPLTRNIEDGKEKSKLVSLKAKQVYEQFKEKQAEYRDHQERWIASMLTEGTENEVPRGDDVVNVDGHVNGHVEVGPFHLTNTQLQQPSHNDQLGEVSATDQLPGNQSLSLYEAEAGPSITPGLFASSTPASGLNFNSGNQMVALLQVVNTSQHEKQWLQQLVDTLQQEKQELKWKNQVLKRKHHQEFNHLQAQVSELQREFREHMVGCCGANRSSKKRCDVGEMGDQLAGE